MADQSLRPGQTKTIFNAATVPQNDSITSDILEVRHCLNGVSLLLEVTSSAGSGTVSLFAVEGNESGGTFVTDSPGLITGMTKTGGNDSNGKAIAVISDIDSLFVKFKVTETANAEDVTVTLKATGLGYARS